MIRTRDFLLFVVVLLFLCMGIVFTLFEETVFKDEGETDFALSSDEAPVFSASAPTLLNDREGTIARLRALLEEDKSVITADPSVEEVLSIESEVEVGTATDTQSIIVSIDRCGGLDDSLSYAKNWPLTETTLSVADGRRVVTHAQKNATAPVDVNASSTVSNSPAIPTVLLSLPLTPMALSEPVCVPSDIVGVTTYGALIFNTDVSLYLLHTPQMLIGYARDGFPIYGSYQGEVDRCGGYDHPAGYRYSISHERNFIIGCFQGSPASFTGL